MIFEGIVEAKPNEELEQRWYSEHGYIVVAGTACREVGDILSDNVWTPFSSHLKKYRWRIEAKTTVDDFEAFNIATGLGPKPVWYEPDPYFYRIVALD